MSAHRRRTSRLRSGVVVLTTLAFGAAGCADRDDVRVTLFASAPEGIPVRSMEVRAQLTGPVQGLRYHWFSGTGQVNPQETDDRATVFTFADGTSHDRVSVDVWRGERRVAHDDVDVTLDESRALPAPAVTPVVDVAITTVPPYDSAGGPHTRATISGHVTSVRSPEYRVVVYARVDVWYIQPHPYMLHPIAADGSWSTWTHTGSSYAVLVVRSGFDPLPRYDVLPQRGGDVVARATAEGLRK